MRGRDEGPPYHAILVGKNYGGSGTYNIHAACRPGPVRITVHETGMTPTTPPNFPFSLRISVEDTRMIYEGVVHDGQVIVDTVRSGVRIMTGGLADEPFRIEYDCEND